MTLAERQAAVDAWIGSRLGSVGAMQASRLAADGRYWQGAWTHDAPPVDGPGEAPNLGRTINGRPSWAAVGAGALIPNPARARVSVDEYAHPDGRGWIIRVQFSHDGETWQRLWGFGPAAADLVAGWHVHSDALDPAG